MSVSSNFLSYPTAVGTGYIESKNVSSIDTSGSDVVISTEQGRVLTITYSSSKEAGEFSLDLIKLIFQSDSAPLGNILPLTSITVVES